ncbi:MAG: ABC transporter permease [Clostridia bacterium]|nr:ABC transporter permease [Clostridia bacterium]
MEEEKTPETEKTDAGTDQKFNDLHGEVLGDRVKVLSPGRTVAKRFFRSKLSIVGLVILVALFIISFFGPLISPWGETQRDTSGKTIVNYSEVRYTDADGNVHVGYDISVSTSEWNSEAAPSAEHWLGTDENGYDLFTRLMYGGRVSLTIGFVVVLLETLIGVILGGLAGYFGGRVDNLIMRLTDILYCIPTLPIMLIFSTVFDAAGINSIIRLYYMMGILTLIGWAGIARLVRGQILSLREQDFMLAAKCSGLSVKRKIFKHLLPNVLPQLIVSMTLGLGSIILTEATLGFLGIGAPPLTATWGTMINSASNSIRLSNFPNFWVPPGICITLAILAFNFVGDGLRDAFDPKMKR